MTRDYCARALWHRARALWHRAWERALPASSMLPLSRPSILHGLIFDDGTGGRLSAAPITGPHCLQRAPPPRWSARQDDGTLAGGPDRVAPRTAWRSRTRTDRTFCSGPSRLAAASAAGGEGGKPALTRDEDVVAVGNAGSRAGAGRLVRSDIGDSARKTG